MYSVFRCFPYSDVVCVHGRGEYADSVVIDAMTLQRDLGYDGARLAQRVNALSFKRTRHADASEWTLR